MVSSNSSLMKLTKTAYLSYLECPREFWLGHHRPDLFAKPLSLEVIHRIRMGYGVQAQAKVLFSRGGFGECEFERPFETGRLSTRTDIFSTDKQTGKNAIYEVKSTKSVKDEHIYDLAFQKITAEGAGVPIGRTFLVYLNGDYVRRGEIEPEKLLAIKDVTEAVDAKLEETRSHIENAFRYLEKEPGTGIAEYCKARKLDCAFIRHAHTDLPEYTIFDIKRFYGKKFDQLLAMGVLDIMDVPADFALNPKMRNQVNAAQTGEPVIEAEEIREKIGGLEYPLYFLDYETISYAIPLFDGYKPYQQIVFQFSLHIQQEKDGELRHCEFLADCAGGEPAAEMLKALKQHIAQDGGTVIVWFQEFEKTRNSEMAEFFAEHAGFMNSVNERVFDLMKIFDEGHYVHPKFKGSASIKKVLPVLAPDLSYDDLEISQGMLASISWLDMLLGETPEELHEQTRGHLLEYCKMDTRAMAEIFGFLRREFCR